MEDTSKEDQSKFLTRPQVASRYGVSPRTISNWENESKEFPAPIRFGGGPRARPYWRLADLEAWEGSNSRR